MPPRRDFILHYGDSWLSPKVWIPVVNNQFTDLNNYYIRAQAREYPDEITPVFDWTVDNGGILVGKAKLRYKDGREFETGAISLSMNPDDWDGKPQSWKGFLEIEIASSDDDRPEFRKTIESGLVVRVLKDSTR